MRNYVSSFMNNLSSRLIMQAPKPPSAPETKKQDMRLRSAIIEKLTFLPCCVYYCYCLCISFPFRCVSPLCSCIILLLPLFSTCFQYFFVLAPLQYMYYSLEQHLLLSHGLFSLSDLAWVHKEMCSLLTRTVHFARAGMHISARGLPSRNNSKDSGIPRCTPPERYCISQPLLQRKGMLQTAKENM